MRRGASGGEKIFGRNAQTRGRERSGDLLHPPARQDYESRIGGGKFLQGLGNIDDGLSRAEFEIAGLNGQVDPSIDGVIQKGICTRDEEFAFKPDGYLRDRFAGFYTEWTLNPVHIERRGKFIAV